MFTLLMTNYNQTIWHNIKLNNEYNSYMAKFQLHLLLPNVLKYWYHLLTHMYTDDTKYHAHRNLQVSMFTDNSPHTLITPATPHVQWSHIRP